MWIEKWFGAPTGILYQFHINWYFISSQLGISANVICHKNFVMPMLIVTSLCIFRNVVSRFTFPRYPSYHNIQPKSDRRRLPLSPEKSCANHHQQLATGNSGEVQYWWWRFTLIVELLWCLPKSRGPIWITMFEASKRACFRACWWHHSVRCLCFTMQSDGQA